MEYDYNQGAAAPTKICKYCKSEIHKDAKICPNCRKKQKRGGCLSVLLILLAVVVLLIVAGGVLLGGTKQPSAPVQSEPVVSSTPRPTVQPALSEETTNSQSDPEPSSSAATIESESAESMPAESTAAESTAAESTAAESEQATTGIDPDFKAAMDSYEEMMDQYVEFMQKYENSDNTAGMLVDYAVYMGKYADAMNKLDAIDESKLNKEETAYYVEVTSRVTQKLIMVS